MNGHNASLTLLSRFIHKRVQVDTPIGALTGVLRKAAPSFHMGIGSLLLETGDDWLLIKSWLVIKR